MAWSVHCCPLNRHCRRYGAPWRIEFNTPWWHLGIALSPDNRYAHIGGQCNWFLFTRWRNRG